MRIKIKSRHLFTKNLIGIEVLLIQAYLWIIILKYSVAKAKFTFVILLHIEKFRLFLLHLNIILIVYWDLKIILFISDFTKSNSLICGSLIDVLLDRSIYHPFLAFVSVSGSKLLKIGLIVSLDLSWLLNLSHKHLMWVF